MAATFWRRQRRNTETHTFQRFWWGLNKVELLHRTDCTTQDAPPAIETLGSHRQGLTPYPIPQQPSHSPKVGLGQRLTWTSHHEGQGALGSSTMVTDSLQPMVVRGDPPRQWLFICPNQKDPGSLPDALPGPSQPPFMSSPLGPTLSTSDLLQDTLAYTHLSALSGSGHSSHKGRHVTCPIGFRTKAREPSLASHNQLGYVSEKLRRLWQTVGS